MVAPARPVPPWKAARPALLGQPVVDGLLPWTPAFLPPGADLARTLRRFHACGVDHVSITAAAGDDGPQAALATLGALRRQVDEQASWLVPAGSPAAIRAAAREGRLSVSFHFQTATPLAADLDLVRGFKAAGIDRAILAYNEANAAGDGCHEPRNGGLSALGLRLVAEMDAAGMRVDLSHCGERTSLEAIDAGARPPFFSHSNARRRFDHERNLSDAQIRACGARGGYIGLNGVGMFLGAKSADIPRAMAEHAAYVAEIAGAACVGLGLDFMYLEGSDYGFFHGSRARWPRGYPDPPWDFLQPEQLGALVEELERAGFTAAEVAGILGGNYLRSLE